MSVQPIKTTGLSEQKCTPCRGGVEPLTEPALSQRLQQLSEGWRVVEGRRLEKDFKFKNFKEALEFTNKVGQLAEQQQHHPDITLSWGKAKIQLWTHKIGGLHENDFILAAGIDRIVDG
jgi:4a-hydroxytetrahydrobiopterin dehydratase